MAPNSHQEARLRKAVLSLAKETEFGKRMVNGGRLSVPLQSTTCRCLSPDARCVARRTVARLLHARTPPLAAPGEPAYLLTDAFRRGGTRLHSCCLFSNGAALDAPDGVKDIRIGGEGGLADPSGPCRKAL